MVSCVALVDQLFEARVEIPRIQIDERDVKMRAQRLLHLLLGDEVQVQQDFSEAEVRLPLVLQRGLELGLGDHLGLDQHVTEPILLVVSVEDSFSKTSSASTVATPCFSSDFRQFAASQSNPTRPRITSLTGRA